MWAEPGDEVGFRQSRRQAFFSYLHHLFPLDHPNPSAVGRGLRILAIREAHVSFRQQLAAERLPDFHGTYKRTGATVWVKPNQIFGRITHLQPIYFGAPDCDACDLSQSASARMLHDRTVRGDFITPRCAQGRFLFHS